MSTPEPFSFNNRDIDGNESEEPESSSDESDLESIPPPLSEDFGEDIEENDTIEDDDDDDDDMHPDQWKIETILRTRGGKNERSFPSLL